MSHEFVRREERDLGRADVRAPAGVGTGVYVGDEQHVKVRGRGGCSATPSWTPPAS